MPSRLPTIRADVPIGRLKDGTLVYLDENWIRRVLRPLVERVGGEEALTNLELADAADFALSEVLLQRAPVDQIFPDVNGLGSESAMPDLVFQTAPAADLGDLFFQPH